MPPIAAVREGAVLPDEPLDRIRRVPRAIAMTAVGAVVGVAAITTTPGNTLVSVLLAVLGLILTLFGCALFPSRTVGALVSMGLGFGALLYGLFVPGLGTTGVLLWMGVGVLLVFFGVARVSTRLIPQLAVMMSPIARWAVFLLSVVFWPFFTLPYWLLRHGAWGPGRRRPADPRVPRRRAPESADPRDRPDHVDPEGRDSLGAGVADGVPRRCPRPLDNARRHRKRAPEPAAHSVHRGRADDRPRARHARRDAGRRHRLVVHRFGERLFTGDYAITAQNNFSPIPIDAAEAAAKAPGVIAVGNVRTGEALVYRSPSS